MSNTVGGPNSFSPIPYPEIPDDQETKIILSKRTLKRGELTDLEIKLHWNQSVETVTIHEIPQFIPVKLIETLVEKIAIYQGSKSEDKSSLKGIALMNENHESLAVCKLKITTIAQNLGIAIKDIFEIETPKELEVLINKLLPTLSLKLTPEILQKEAGLEKAEALTLFLHITQVFNSSEFTEPQTFHKIGNFPRCMVMDPTIGSIRIKLQPSFINAGGYKKVLKSVEFAGLHSVIPTNAVELVFTGGKTNDLRGFWRERELMIRLNLLPEAKDFFPSISPSYSTYQAKNNPSLKRIRTSMPLYNGDLSDLENIFNELIDLNSKNPEIQKFLIKIQILKQIATEVQYLHAKGVIHRDLKLGNIFFKIVDDKLIIIVGDLGLARYGTDNFDPGGTRGYIAPECYKGTKNNENTDNWSLGLIVYNIFTGKERLFNRNFFYYCTQKDIDDMIDKSHSAEQGFLDDQINQTIPEILKGMLQIDSTKRWNLDTLIKKLEEIESLLKNEV